MLNKISVSELAELSNFSKAYISQVKNGKRPPSEKLISMLEESLQPKKPDIDYYKLFMQSRLAKEISPTTIRFYKVKLGRFLEEVNPDKAKQQQIEKFLLQFPNPGNRHGYYQVIKTFYIWREQTLGLPNIVKYLPAPKLGKLILPSLTTEQVKLLIDAVNSKRDKAMIALLTESGLRLSELAGVKDTDINWEDKMIELWGRAGKRRIVHLVRSQRVILSSG